MISDVQDILHGDELSSQSGEGAVTFESLIQGDQKKKKAGTKRLSDSGFKRPEGMHRELYNLLVTDKTDSPPLIPTLSTSHRMSGYQNPKVRLGLRRPRSWKWIPFSNPARQDNCLLHHWRRGDKLDDEYPFARFNKVLQMPSYTDEDYHRLLNAPGWTREETDHLMDLCQRFDLRWPIVHDRWDRERFRTRSIEDMKERYYNLCNALTRARTSPDEVPVLLNFDADHERRRKEQLEKLWNRTEEQIEEEEQLVQELRKIEARRRERERKAQDLQKLITAADRAPPTPQADSALPIKKKHLKAGRPPTVNAAAAALQAGGEVTTTGVKFPDCKGQGPHMRSARMKIPQQIGQKKLKAVEQALEKLELEPHPIATEQICANFNELRSDIVLLYELKSALASTEYELEALRQQYQTLTGKDLDIPARVRINNPDPDLSSLNPEDPPSSSSSTPTLKRRITDAMDLTTASVPIRKRRVVVEQPNILKRLRRS